MIPHACADTEPAGITQKASRIATNRRRCYNRQNLTRIAETHMRISHWKSKTIGSLVYLGVVALLYTSGISCLYQHLFGVCCPGCGMTRALLAALRLDFKTAFSYHPMFWSVPLLYLYFWLDNGIFLRRSWNTILLCGIGVGFLINWIVNLL